MPSAPSAARSTGQWRWLEFKCQTGEEAMAEDRALFDAMKRSAAPPLLRFYRWSLPALSYGRTQGLDAAAAARAERGGLPAVRRPTGGGKVLHGEDTCFSLFWKKGEGPIPWGVNDSYCVIHRWLRQGLERLGVETDPCGEDPPGSAGNSWCFESPVAHDLLSGGRKIVGGAQWRDGRAALHQGSIRRALSPEEAARFKSLFAEMFGAEFI